MERVGDPLHGSLLSHFPSFSRWEALTVLLRSQPVVTAGRLIAIGQVMPVAGVCYWLLFQFGRVLRLCDAVITYDMEGSWIR